MLLWQQLQSKVDAILLFISVFMSYYSCLQYGGLNLEILLSSLSQPNLVFQEENVPHHHLRRVQGCARRAGQEEIQRQVGGRRRGGGL